MKKIIIISHSFPPSTAANAKRPFLIARDLLARGYEVEVISSYRDLQNGFSEKLVHNNFRIKRIHDPLAEPVLRWLKTNSRIKHFFANTIKYLSWPDFSVIWVLRVLYYLKTVSFDRVIVGINPKSIILFSLFPSICNSRWIVDYQDSLTPYLKVVPSKSLINKLLNPYFVRLEKKLLWQVGDVIFTSENNMNAYTNMGLVDKSKSTVIYSFYDESIYDDSIYYKDDIFEIVYAGNFDMTCRSPEIFLKSFSIFLSENPDARKKCKISIYGHDWLPAHNQLLAQLKLEQYVHISPPLEYVKFLHTLQAGCVLLLITALEHKFFIPGKLSDYFGAERPILSFVPPESEVNSILLKTDSAPYICKADSVSDGVIVITKLWREFKQGALNRKFSKNSSFSLQSQMDKVIKLL